jgi:glycosyltransferase involved in cell wall biosynthesis
LRVLSVGNLYPPASIGGYEFIWRSWVEHMRERGHQVHVLTSDHRASETEPAPEVERELRLYWADHEFPRFGWRERLALERHNAAVLEQRLEELAPDAVAWWAMGGMSLALLERVRRRGLPAVGGVCDDWMLYGPKVDAWAGPFAGRPRVASIAERLTGQIARIEVGAAAHWLFLSETIRRRALEGGVEVGASEICNRGPDDDLFKPVPASTWRWRLAYVGRIDERKGIDTAIEALAALPEEARLVVNGSGDDEHAGELRRLAARLGIDRRVEFTLRPREEIPQLYAEADAVLFPVRWEEPWGLVPLEAMAVGRPVVATGTGGSGEYLRDRHNSLLFEPSDAEGLAAAIRDLAADPKLRARLVEGGFETAARFSERAFNEQVERALEREVARAERGEGR